MKVFIKNMVCPRCIMVVRNILIELNIEAENILLGEIDIREVVSIEKLQLLATKLQEVGFEILDDPGKISVEKIKKLIIEKVQSGNIEPHFVLSSYLKSKTLKDYSTLTKVFSASEGCTIEKYFILQKLEKAREMLLYGHIPVKNLARSLGYSSPQHFSAQFRKVYKYSPKQLKALGAIERKSIDNVY